MARYMNGAVPASARRTVNGISLLKATANATERLIAAAKADGVAISIWKPSGGYRSLATQIDMHRPSRRSYYNMSAATQKLLSPPGFSPHGTGKAVDFYGGNAWLHKNAKNYGFTWALGARDPNHWVHDGKTKATPIKPAGGTTTPIEQEVTMSTLVKVAKKSDVYLVEEFSVTKVDPTRVSAFEAAYGKTTEFKEVVSLEAVTKAAQERRSAFIADVAKAATTTVVNNPTQDNTAVLKAIAGVPAAIAAYLGLKKA